MQPKPLLYQIFIFHGPHQISGLPEGVPNILRKWNHKGRNHIHSKSDGGLDKGGVRQEWNVRRLTGELTSRIGSHKDFTLHQPFFHEFPGYGQLFQPAFALGQLRLNDI